MGDFERDTRVEGGDGAYVAQLSADWEIWGPNGGYLAAIALRAAGREAAVKRPASLSVHFLSVARFAPVDVEVRCVRAGRSTESFGVSLRQAGKPVLEALVRTAAHSPGLEHVYGSAPEVPEPETLPSADELWEDGGPRYPFWRNLEVGICETDRDWSKTRPPVLQEWYRYRPSPDLSDPFLEAGRAALLIDTMSWPAAARAHPNSGYRAPNLDLAVWFHAGAPKSDWLLLDAESPRAAGGLMGTSARVYDRERNLLAGGGAQLFCIPEPPGS